MKKNKLILETIIATIFLIIGILFLIKVILI